jgi:hypothetical protein
LFEQPYGKLQELSTLPEYKGHPSILKRVERKLLQKVLLLFIKATHPLLQKSESGLISRVGSLDGTMLLSHCI